MTTRAQLESERDVLVGIRDDINPVTGSHRIAALTASIARVEVLLSLSDERANNVALYLTDKADAWEARAADMGDDGRRDMASAAEPFRTVAALIRREPRGDV